MNIKELNAMKASALIHLVVAGIVGVILLLILAFEALSAHPDLRAWLFGALGLFVSWGVLAGISQGDYE